MISIIAAVAKNNAIGNKNKLIYWLPDDLKRFKALTTGNTIIMGRKTFESLPKGALPNRRNVVISRTTASFTGCDTYPTLEDALQSCESQEQIYIIGGASVYEQSLAFADRLCLTEIEAVPEEADVFFPDLGEEWHEVWSEQHEKDEKHSERFRFVDYEKDTPTTTIPEGRE